MSWGASWGRWNRYGDAVRRDVHQLLAWGYQDARPSFVSQHDETDITGLIADAIRCRLYTVAPIRFDQYFVADDTPQPGEERTGTSRRRADIIIEWSGSRPRLRYILEAKRLRRRTHPLRAYTGSEGLMRFVRGSYAPHASEAAMVAYVQSPSVTDWEEALVKVFGGSKRSSLGVMKGLDAHAVVPELSHSWVSVHKRAIGAQITMFHILLDCCTENT